MASLASLIRRTVILDDPDYLPKYITKVDNDLIAHTADGDLNKVKKTINRGVSKKGFDAGVKNAAANGRLDVIKFLLSKSDDLYRHIELATAYTDKELRFKYNDDLRLYLLKAKIDFVIHKRYEVA